jgi:ferric-dicitrate binding protein FerR (iron transport regulator)
MTSAKGHCTLKPGQQAQVAKNGQLAVDEHADVEEAVAWKNGRFQFDNADVETVMREIARWYDVEIVYAGKVPAEKFEGEIPRSSNIEEVFKILELSNVHCKIEGRKITVLP